MAARSQKQEPDRPANTTTTTTIGTTTVSPVTTLSVSTEQLNRQCTSDSTELLCPDGGGATNNNRNSVVLNNSNINIIQDQVLSVLPDILNSHQLPPSYQPHPIVLPPTTPRPPPPAPPARPPLPSRLRPNHHHHQSTSTSPIGRCPRLEMANYLRPACAATETESSASKSCLTCSKVLSIRWFILLVAAIGLLCAIIGTVLGAVRTTGREHLTLALLMIGVGIILITVSGIAWRLTSTGPSWRSLLGLADHHLHHHHHHHHAHQGGQSLCPANSLVGDPTTSRRFVPRVPAPYGRGATHHHPYGAMFYPEFQYRPPPPSYQASMQEYRLRLLLLDRSVSAASAAHHPPPATTSSMSPPPTYRSSVTSSLAGTLHRHVNVLPRPAQQPSRPPSYRAAASGDQNASHVTVSNVGSSNTPTSTNATSQQPTNSESSPASSPQHDVNRVTILQTNDTSQVCTPNGVNIVAILPGNQQPTLTQQPQNVPSITTISGSSTTSCNAIATLSLPSSTTTVTTTTNTSQSSSPTSSTINLHQRSNGIQILALI